MVAAEPLEFLVADVDLLSETESSCCLCKESGSVGVERLVDRCSARLCTNERYSSRAGLLGSLGGLVASEVLDESLHAELDKVEGQEPLKTRKHKSESEQKPRLEMIRITYNYIPDPDDSDPST